MKDAAKPENANVQPQQPDFSRVYGGDDDKKKHALDCERFALTLTRAPSVVCTHLETLALAHCPTGTVVWANTRSHVYHFRNTNNYGNTNAGAYMCEQDALAEGIRAAKNEKHP